MNFKILLGSLAMLVSMAAAAAAGSMNTFLTVSARYDNDTSFNPLPLHLNAAGSVPAGFPGLYKVDISFTATKDAGEKGWGDTLFDMGVGPNLGGSHLALNLSVGYLPNVGVLDINNIQPGGVSPIFATNLDAGVPGDLKNILAAIESPRLTTTASDTRNQLGTPLAPVNAGYPSLIGSVMVDWNGLGTGSVVLSKQQFAFTIDTNPQSAGFYLDTQNGAGATLLFGVPEPATLTLTGLAFAGLIGVVRLRSQLLKRTIC